MSVVMRGGNEADFQPNKMKAREFGVILDKKKVYMTFAPGDCKQLMTVEDATAQLEQAVQVATGEAQGYATSASSSASSSETSAQNSEYFASNAQDSASASETSAQNAQLSENEALDYSMDSEAWAVGKRGGIDVASGDETYKNNSKFYSEIAKTLNDASQKVLDDSREILEAAQKKIVGANFTVDLNTGLLLYNDDSDYTFHIDETTGELMWDYAS